MNKSIFGQVMAISIIAIPAVVFGWLMFTLRSIGGTGGGTITTVAMWVFGATLAAIVLYFMIALGWKHREKAKMLVSGAKNLFNGGSGAPDESWWNKKDLESQRWFLYTALAVLAITAVYVTPDKYSGDRFIVSGWIVLLGLHLVIWPFFTEKISLVTKVVITGFILFFIVAVVLPNATQMEVANVKEKIASFDRNYGEPTASHATPQAQPAVEPTQSWQERSPIPPIIAIQGVFRGIRVPNGNRVSWYCQQGVLVRIIHSKLPQGKTAPCDKIDEQNPVHLGEVTDLRLDFTLDTKITEPKLAYVTLIPSS